MDGRATASMVLAIIGLVLGIPLGLPGMVLGPIAYFMGRPAQMRIDASNGSVGGHSQAQAGWVLGIVATATGCLSFFAWFVVFLLVVSAGTS